MHSFRVKDQKIVPDIQFYSPLLESSILISLMNLVGSRVSHAKFSNKIVYLTQVGDIRIEF